MTIIPSNCEFRLVRSTCIFVRMQSIKLPALWSSTVWFLPLSLPPSALFSKSGPGFGCRLSIDYDDLRKLDLDQRMEAIGNAETIMMSLERLNRSSYAWKMRHLQISRTIMLISDNKS